MPLNTLQRHLERIYEVEVDPRVEDFLLTDRIHAHALERSAAARETSEKLLVAESPDAIDVALYLDAGLLRRLRRDDPTARVHAGNLEDLLTAVEGVSHFLYLVWNASHERPVSLLELEVQAEVDKYVAAAFLFGRQRDGRIPARLHDWLFGDPTFDPELSPEDLERYREAHARAARFCSDLERRFLRPGASAGRLLSELRRFYRLSREDKLRRSEAAI